MYSECFAKDPKCAMAMWGVAYCVSSSYNWSPGLGSGHDAIQAAVGLKEGLTDLEKDLIDALAQRHSAEARDGADPTKLSMGNKPELNVAFANAMAPLYEKYVLRARRSVSNTRRAPLHSTSATARPIRPLT